MKTYRLPYSNTEIDMNDLSTLTKLQFVENLINTSNLSVFYYYHESELLSMEFNFNDMKEKFKKWVIGIN